MLGFSNFWIGLIYILNIVAGLGCLAYGILNWNKGEDVVSEEDKAWAREEKVIEQELN